MASLQRTIKREMIFKDMSKAQRTVWKLDMVARKHNRLREAILKHSEKE